MLGSDIPSSSSSSFSTYGAVIINPDPESRTRPSDATRSENTDERFDDDGRTATGPTPVTSRPTPMTPPRLVYPFPLPLVALLDAAYVAYHGRSHTIPSFLIGLTVLRVVVLGLVAGCSKRWRSRGGWVAAASGMSIGVAIWRDCVDQLTRRNAPGGDGTEGGKKGEDQSMFLYTTILIAISEYLFFLLLLRLSPPHHRIQPLSLLHSSSATQQPVPFAYTSTDDPRTPRSMRLRRYSAHTPHTASPYTPAHARVSSLFTGAEAGPSGLSGMRGVAAIGAGAGAGGGARSRLSFSSDTRPRAQAFGPGSNNESGESYWGRSPLSSGVRGHREEYSPSINDSHISHTHHDHDTSSNHNSISEDDDDDDDDDSDEFDYDSASSISESSIIDLPPPLSPQRVQLPPSLSTHSGLNVAGMNMGMGMGGISLARAIDSSPLLGPIVRRTRSARFGRSFGSVMDGDGDEAGRRMREGRSEGAGGDGRQERERERESGRVDSPRRVNAREEEEGYGTFER